MRLCAAEQVDLQLAGVVPKQAQTIRPARRRLARGEKLEAGANGRRHFLLESSPILAVDQAQLPREGHHAPEGCRGHVVGILPVAGPGYRCGTFGAEERLRRVVVAAVVGPEDGFRPISVDEAVPIERTDEVLRA